MLRKLIKHEFIATTKYMLPLNLFVLLAILLAKAFIALRISNNTHEVVIGMMLLSFIIILVVSMIATMIYFIIRFYRNLFTDEGYLMFTLPAAPWQHIVSKGIAAFTWQAVNGILVFGSIPFLLSSVISTSDWQQFLRMWNIAMAEYYSSFGHSFTALAALLLVSLIVSMVTAILRVYAAIAIGQLVTRHKVIGSVAAYFVIGIITSVFSSVLSMLTSFGSMNTLTTGDSAIAIMTSAYSSMIYSIILSIVYCIVFYFIAQYLMTKKLNLD